MELQQYTTRSPITVEAFQFQWDNLVEVKDLLPIDAWRPLTEEMKREKFLVIVTPLGSKELREGDYLMRSQYGHWYPINGGLFESLYCPVEKTV
jgi:hypothetical protein